MARYDDGYLTPLVGAPKRKKFLTFDIESKHDDTQAPGFTRPFLVGMYDGKNYNAFFDSTVGGHWGYRYFQAGGCVDRFMCAYLTKGYRGFSAYAHNGGTFDFLHLLPWLALNMKRLGLTLSIVPIGGSGILCIDVWKSEKKWHRWRFVDSMRLLPMSLDKAARALEVGEKYKSIDGKQVLDEEGQPFTMARPETDRNWIQYNRSDCELLYGALRAVHDLIEGEFGGEVGLTAPSTAMKTYRRGFFAEPIARDVHTHAFVRESYAGGRTSWLNRRGRNLHYYDFNSSYPASMTEPMPAGGSVHWGDGEPPTAWLREKIGFCRCTVYVPPMHIPPLPVRASGAFFPEGSGVDGKLTFPCGYLQGVWEWAELQNAIECGCEILQWHESWWFDGKTILNEFVRHLYKYRDSAHCFRCGCGLSSSPEPFWCEACEDVGYRLGLDALAKLMINSTYGKFGEVPLKLKLYWRGDPNMPDGAYPLVEGDQDSQIWVAEEESDSAFVMPQVAARVTALSRVKLHRAAILATEKLVLRRCVECESAVTFYGKRTSKGYVLGEEVGGCGTHGDAAATARIRRGEVLCPCGGCLETVAGEVYYMDTDSLMTNVVLPNLGTELGQLKDEVPRYSGFLSGEFYGLKMYALSVEPSYLRISEDVRLAMLQRDVKHMAEVADVRAEIAKDDWQSVRAKGLGKNDRTVDNLRAMFEGELSRLKWEADPCNRDDLGRLLDMPEELQAAGTIVERRFEKLGTLAKLKRKGSDGELRTDAFYRGPRMIDVPKRLHVKGGKRIENPDGTTTPYTIDMRAEAPTWWKSRLERTARRRDRALQRRMLA